MTPVDVVCLCETYDLKGFFGADFAQSQPHIQLLRPEEVRDPTAIRHAFAFNPGPDAFAAYPNLAMVSSGGAGVDGLLLNPSLRPEILVSRMMVTEQADMIAGFALWHIIGWQRQMAQYQAQQRSRVWDAFNREGPGGFPVGILGYGQLGGTLARALIGLGYPVRVYGSRARVEDGVEVLAGVDGLAEVLRESHAVVNMLPLTDATIGILNAETFAQMREDAILIHVGRGGHLVEDDLVAALEAGRPAHAVLDVFTTEPLPDDHVFWGHDKITVTPHVAGEPKPAIAATFAVEGIAAFERGEQPLGYVDRDRGY